jgi:hypothetical protein
MRVALTEASDGQRRQVLKVSAPNPGPEDQADRLRRDPAGHESKDARRGAIEPLLVIDEAYDRALSRHL